MTDSSDRQIGDRDRSVPWYNEHLEKLSDGTRELLENYSGIPKDQVLPHIYKVVCQHFLEVHSLVGRLT